MRKISAFLFITLNGYFKGPGENIGWHLHGEEGNEFSEKQLEANNILLFGRKTYELMSSFWSSKMAYDSMQKIAERMNQSEKLVLSNRLVKANWQNTQIISGNGIDKIRKLKQSTGKNITILGSGSVVSDLTEAGLIDEYEFLIDPIAIGSGTTIFENLRTEMSLTLIESRVFKNSGSVLLKYHRTGIGS